MTQFGGISREYEEDIQKFWQYPDFPKQRTGLLSAVIHWLQNLNPLDLLRSQQNIEEFHGILKNSISGYVPVFDSGGRKRNRTIDFYEWKWQQQEQ